MRAAVILLWLASSTVAHADAGDRSDTLVSVPLVLGAELESADTRTLLGVRPEVVHVRDPYWRGFKTQLGFGGYAELAGGGGERVVGAGVTFVRYGDASIAPSLGLFATLVAPEPRQGVAASVFVGMRRKHWNIGCDAPMGFRLDVRSSFDGDRTFAVAAQLDVPGLLLGLLAGAAYKPPG